MAARFVLSGQQILSAAGKPISNGKIDFWANGTTTDQDTFPTSALSGANANPLVLDANGRVPEAWANASDVFSIRVLDENDNIIVPTIDDISFLNAFSLTAADVLGVLSGNSTAVVIDGPSMGGTSFANFLTALTLTAAGSINTAAGSLTIGATTLSGGNITPTDGNGMDFSNITVPAGSLATLLKFFDYGEWDPVFADASSGGNEATLSDAEGFYVKIGPLVFIAGRFTVSSIAGMTGANQAFITGLPYPGSSAPSSASFTNGVIAIRGTSMAMAGNGDIPIGLIEKGDSFISMGKWDDSVATGVTAMTVSEWPASATIYFSDVYLGAN